MIGASNDNSSKNNQLKQRIGVPFRLRNNISMAIPSFSNAISHQAFRQVQYPVRKEDLPQYAHVFADVDSELIAIRSVR